MSTGIYPAPVGGSGGSSTLVIPELTSDPISPSPQQAWVLYTVVGGTGGNAGQPIGLLLSLTYAGSGGSSSYKFSYQSLEGPIVRTTLS